MANRTPLSIVWRRANAGGTQYLIAVEDAVAGVKSRNGRGMRCVGVASAQLLTNCEVRSESGCSSLWIISRHSCSVLSVNTLPRPI